MPLLKGPMINKGRILTRAVILVLLLLFRNQSVSVSVFLKNLMLTEARLTVNQLRTTVTHRWRVLVCQTVVGLNSGDVRKPTFSTPGRNCRGQFHAMCFVPLRWAQNKASAFLTLLPLLEGTRISLAMCSLDLDWEVSTVDLFLNAARTPETCEKHDQRLISVRFWKRPHTVHANTKRKRLMMYFF